MVHGPTLELRGLHSVVALPGGIVLSNRKVSKGCADTALQVLSCFVYVLALLSPLLACALCQYWSLPQAGSSSATLCPWLDLT